MTADQANALNALLDETLTVRPEVRKLKPQEQACAADACAVTTDAGEKKCLDDRAHFFTRWQDAVRALAEDLSAPHCRGKLAEENCGP